VAFFGKIGRCHRANPNSVRIEHGSEKMSLRCELLAERIGTSARYVQSLEAGEYFPRLPTLMRLKSGLRCNWEELFGGCDKV